MVDSMPWHAKAGSSSRDARLDDRRGRPDAPHHRPHRRRVRLRAVRPRGGAERGAGADRRKRNRSTANCSRRLRRSRGLPALRGRAMGRGLKLGVGTAGDKHNIAFAMSHLQMDSAPLAIVGGDEGLPGKPAAGHLSRSRSPPRRAPGALHRLRGRALRHRGRAPRRHARGGGLHHPQRRRTGRAACDRARARLQRTRQSNFLETLNA